MGLSGLANDNSNNGAAVAWDASALLSVAHLPKPSTGGGIQRDEKRRRQAAEAQKPFNDDALREGVSPFCLLPTTLVLVASTLTLLRSAW